MGAQQYFKQACLNQLKEIISTNSEPLGMIITVYISIEKKIFIYKIINLLLSVICLFFLYEKCILLND